MTDDFPPDSRTGLTATTVETQNGQMPQHLAGMQQQIAPQQQVPAHILEQFPMDPPAVHPQAPSGPPPGMVTQQVEPERTYPLEDAMGADMFSQFLEFGAKHTYLGVPVVEMSREELVTALGVFIGDVYKLTAMAPPERQQQSASNMGLAFNTAQGPLNQG